MASKFARKRLAPKIAEHYRTMFGRLISTQFDSMSSSMNRRCHWNAMHHTLSEDDNQVLPVFCYCPVNPEDSFVHFISATGNGASRMYHEVTLGYYGLQTYEYYPMTMQTIRVDASSDMNYHLRQWKSMALDVVKHGTVFDFFHGIKRGHTF